MVTKLAPERHDLIWGSGDTEPWYPNPEGLRTAEVWFPSGELLIKFLFTTDNLSVQVHPNDEQARLAGLARGKTEMWHILRAVAGAKLALGLRRAVTAEELRAAARDGSIVDLLNWIPVSAGQSFFVPAGTIHAIGAGVVLCEIQQLSDVTYRLFDWGRGRELHLAAGVAVSTLEPRGEGPVDLPVVSRYFATARVVVEGELVVANPGTWIVLEGEGTIGEGTIGDAAFRVGDVFRVAAEAIQVRSARAVLLVTREGDLTAG